MNEKNASNKCKYNKYRNKVTNLLRHAKKKYYCERLNYSKNDIKGTWSVINILHKSEKSMPDNFMCNYKEINDPQSIANEFSVYFDNCCSTALDYMPPLDN